VIQPAESHYTDCPTVALNSRKHLASSVMLGRVALVRTDVSEELSASIIRVTRIGKLGTFAVEDATVHDHRREIVKSYMFNIILSPMPWPS
jgi:hypothetical protein